MPLTRQTQVPAVGGRGRLHNLSQRPEDAWLSTAMVEMLTTELAGDGQLRVVPAERTARALRELGAEHRLPLTSTSIACADALATEYVVVGSFADERRGGGAPRPHRRAA